jgi:hypothetical protein
MNLPALLSQYGAFFDIPVGTIDFCVNWIRMHYNGGFVTVQELAQGE